MSNDQSPIILAFSGGLDTSFCVPWLKENYGRDVITACVDTGGIDAKAAVALHDKALALGAIEHILIDAKKDFFDTVIRHLIAGNVLRGQAYPLCVGAERGVQAARLATLARERGASTVAHGCTAAGNDQVRFELTYKALAPQLKVIAPWRVWDIHSREQAIAYAEEHKLDLGEISRENIYSRDWNVWHMSHEGGRLEDPWNGPDESMFRLTTPPQDAPDKVTEVTIDFEKGIPVGIDGTKMKPLDLLTRLNKLGAENGIGRVDIVETRMVGMKSRGVYETPGGTLLYKALRDLEMFTTNYDALSLKQKLSQYYSDLVYSGKWFTTARNSLEAFMVETTQYTTGSVRLSLYKGNATVVGRQSPYALYLEELASFGDTSYDHADAEGFITLYGLATGVTAMVQNRLEDKSGQAVDMKAIAGSYHDK